MLLSNKALLVLIVISVMCSSLAQLLLKWGMSGRAADAVSITWLKTLEYAMTSPAVLAGLALYAFGAVLWLLVLARADLSFAYPFVGLGFVMTLAFGKFALGEAVSAGRVIGSFLVLIGVVLITRGNPN